MKNVFIKKRDGDPYYICSFRVKVHDPVLGPRVVQKTLSTGQANEKQAQLWANKKRKELEEDYVERKISKVNVRDDAPTCGQIVDRYLTFRAGERPEDRALGRNLRAENAARAFLTVVGEGAHIIGDVEKARSIRLSSLNADHLLRWKNQAARKAAKLAPRSPANINFFQRTAQAIFADKYLTEAYRDLNVPRAVIADWRTPTGHALPQTGGFQRIPEELLARLDKRAKKYFLRIAAWFDRHGKNGTLWAKGRAERYANQFRNAHAAYWLVRRCGLRNTEVENLRWDWFHEEQGRIWIDLRGKSYWEPKATPGRALIARDLYEELKAILGPVRSGPEGYVLVGSKDHRDDGVHRAAPKFVRKYLGEERGKALYELRKQYGSELTRKHGLEKACKLLRNTRDTAWKHYVDIVDLNTVEAL